MAALWLQSVSLLVLLIVSCPGSQAIATPQHLCGSLLFDALYLVCGDRGFFYNPKRDVDQKDQMERMVKRGIVEQCCYKPCNIVDLQNFCN